MPSPQYRPAKWCSRQWIFDQHHPHYSPPGFPSGVFILFSSSKIPHHQHIVMKTFKEKHNPSSVGKRHMIIRHLEPRRTYARKEVRLKHRHGSNPWDAGLSANKLKKDTYNHWQIDLVHYLLRSQPARQYSWTINLSPSFLWKMNWPDELHEISPSCSCRTWYEITTYGSFEIHSRHCWCLEGRALYAYASVLKEQLWHYDNQELESCRDLFSNWNHCAWREKLINRYCW